MSAVLDYMRLCRLCLVKDKVHVPIFGAESDVRQIFLKITACLPVKVSQEDNLPKNICNSCLLKVDLLYQFWNTTVNAEKQLIQWLAEIGVDVNIKNTSPPNITPQSHAHPHSMPEAIILKEERPDPEIKSMEQSQNFHMDTQYSGYEMPYQPQVNMTVGAPTDFTQPTDAPAEEDVKVPQQKAQPTKPTPAKRRGRPPKQKTPPAVQLPPPEVPPAATSTATGSKRRSSAAAAAAAFAAAAANASSDESDVDDRFGGDDSDDEDMDVRIAKEEADSEDEEYVDNPESLEPTAFVGVPSTSACDSEQPGPSGLGGAITTGKTSSALPAAAANESGTNEFVRLQNEDDNIKIVVRRKYKFTFCEICNKKCYSKSAYEKHQEKYRSHTIISCTQCDRKFHTDKEVLIHVKTDHEKNFKCYSCSEIFNTMDGVKQHANIHNTDCTKIHQCKFCGERFNNRNSLAYHRRIHLPLPSKEESKAVCDVCGRKFSQMWHLKSHYRIHTGEKPYPCTHCSKLFRSSTALKNHLSVHTNEKPYACPHCDVRCVNKSTLNVHLRKHSGLKPYSCTLCDYKSSYFSSLKAHMNTHTKIKRYNCTQCEKDYANNDSLINHLRTHTGEKPFACDICNKKFINKKQMKKHKISHLDTKQTKPSYSCPQCDKSYLCKSFLKVHIRTHNGEKPFSCTICDKKFTGYNYLRAHMYCHAEEKSHSCSHCGKCFTRPISLRKHIHKLHRELIK